jgi:hypothetical protein
MIRFRGRIEIRGINPYVLVNAERAALLKADWRRPMPVLVNVNGQPDPPWRINMMPVGNGDFYLYLHGQIRGASGTAVGDEVDVEIAFDTDYRGGPGPMPPWFAKELERDAAALEGFERLPPARQKEIVRYMSRLKSPEARQRNTTLALHVLGGGKGRFLARSWNGDDG